VNDRRWWIGIVGGGTALALACGGLVYWQYGVIEQAREEVTGVRAEIESSRKLLTGTPKMEREVIVLRETEEAITVRSRTSKAATWPGSRKKCRSFPCLPESPLRWPRAPVSCASVRPSRCSR
jgi:hypothetical protein